MEHRPSAGVRTNPGALALALVLAVGLMALAPAPTEAQDAHYWSTQYGARADLLGGVVVGALLDLSDTYYNPGALGLVHDPSLLVGTRGFEVYDISTQGRLVEKELSSTKFRVLPSFFGLSLGKQLVFTVLTRQDFDLNISNRDITPYGGVSGTPEDPYHSLESYYIQNLQETWGGLTWFDRLGDHAGIGVTGYASLRNQGARAQVILQEAGSEGNGASLVAYDDFSFYNVRLLAKVGLAFDYSPLTFGFTLTTPGLSLFGSGHSAVNFSSLGGEEEGAQLVSNYQEDLPARWRSPISVAAGASYRLDNLTLHTSAEWFNKVDSFQVMEPEPFVGQTTGKTTQLEFENALDAVFNFGLGVHYEFNGKTAVFASFVTDFSSLPDGATSPFAVATWDIYHFSLGANFEALKIDFTVGAALGYGEDDIRHRDDSGDLADNPPDIEPIGGSVRYRRLKLIFGFSLPI